MLVRNKRGALQWPHAYPSLAHFGLVPVGESGDKVVGVGLARSLDHRGIEVPPRRSDPEIFEAIGDVVLDRPGQQGGLLPHQRHVAVEPAVVDFGGRLAIQQHLAYLRLVKVLEKVKARLMILSFFFCSGRPMRRCWLK